MKVAISRTCGKPHYFTKKGVGAFKASLTLTIVLLNCLYQASKVSRVVYCYPINCFLYSAL